MKKPHPLVLLLGGVSLLALATLVLPSPDRSKPYQHCNLRLSQDGRAVLQDLTCTPGAVNPGVNQNNIKQTICLPGWATNQRRQYAPESKTWPIKRQSIIEYGYADKNPALYELDHLIPISLGGALIDPKNLWAEYPASPNEKDAKEAHLRAQVCDGTLTLEEAQREIVQDWVTADP